MKREFHRDILDTATLNGDGCELWLRENTVYLLAIDKGEATVEIASVKHNMLATAAAIIPTEAQGKLFRTADVRGWLVGCSPSVIAKTLGSSEESILIHSIYNRLIISQDISQNFITEFVELFAKLENEINGNLPGSRSAIASYLCLMLVAYWRSGRFQTEVVRGRAGELQVLEGFYRLIELHFRSHLPISQYAELLGVSYDRLHKACQTCVRLSPSQLLQQNMMREATAKLEQSGERIEDIGISLGFSGMQAFGEFFRRHAQISPSTYRARFLARMASTIANDRNDETDF